MKLIIKLRNGKEITSYGNRIIADNKSVKVFAEDHFTEFDLRFVGSYEIAHEIQVSTEIGKKKISPEFAKAIQRLAQKRKNKLTV